MLQKIKFVSILNYHGSQHPADYSVYVVTQGTKTLINKISHGRNEIIKQNIYSISFL